MTKSKSVKTIFLLAIFTIFCLSLPCSHLGAETPAVYAAEKPENARPSKGPDASGPIQAAADSGDSDSDPAAAPGRVTYKEGFSYEPLSQELIGKITGISYPVTSDQKDTALPAVNIAESSEALQISYEKLRSVKVLYYNFDGDETSGELICNEAIAQDIVEIFYELYQNEYPIERIRLIDEYGGDDTLSMLDNNTSCFNYRVVDGTENLSRHALGLAIDINPFYNPYVVYQKDGSAYISPKGSEAYADRSQEFAYKIDEDDLCYRLFKEHGFTWGGHWHSCKDYQHFQKVPEK